MNSKVKAGRSYRIESIDLLRGVVMVIMALDHVRVYFNYGSFFRDPTILATTTPFLFVTRWITHFCAPVFVFLAGTSAFLYGTRRDTRREVSWFLLTRGLWLIVLELTLINFAWSFDVTLSLIVLQVIWAIGFSMIVLSGLVFLPRWSIVLVGAVLVAGHNLLDSVVVEGSTLRASIWYTLHQKTLMPLGPDRAIEFVYPVIPWIGLMTLGYQFGQLYKKGFDAQKRKRLLLMMGSGAIFLFLALRLFNIYGDPAPWYPQSTLAFSIISFFNTTKYPPSFLFLLMTIGPSLIFLALTEEMHNKISTMIVVIGRVPLFFYALHIYVIHLLAIIGIVLAGRPWTEMILTARSFFTASLIDYGYNLTVVYLVWIPVVLFLYPLCKWYNEYKTQNRQKWWLSYL